MFLPLSGDDRIMNALQTLNERFFSGDPQAFDLLFDQLAPKLLGFARSYVALHEAEDIVQDVFISLWQKKNELRYYGKTYQQIADELNISVKTVEKRMSAALALLKKSLGSTLFSWLLMGIAQ